MIFLLDTNTLIHTVRGLKKALPHNERHRELYRKAEKVVDRCRHEQSLGHEVGLSAITVAELEYGARHSGNYEKEMASVRKILMPFMLYEFDAVDCAESYGRVRHALEFKGKSVGAMDLLIAAHALALSARLVTSDTDFARVPDLQCENWTG